MTSEKDLSLPSPGEYLDRTFGEGGYLAQRFNGYRMRSGQVALARAADDAIETGDHLLAEAGTGVGKSVGYLVPATYRASKAEGEILSRRARPDEPRPEEDWAPARVIVVTSNIVLSEQLIRKDLPMLREVLPWPFRFAIMKGRNNYVCVDQLHETQIKGLDFAPSEAELNQFEDIKAWAHDCAQGYQTGDVSELPFEPSFRIWRHLSVLGSECKGADCDFHDTCYSTLAHREARSANVIVTNYHMLMAHLKVKMATGMDLVLPAADTIICDEAHAMADVARDAFGFKIGKEAIVRTARRLRVGDWWQTEQELRVAAEDFFGALESYRASGRYKTRIKAPLSGEAEIAGAWRHLTHASAGAKRALDGHAKDLRTQVDNNIGDTKEARSRLKAIEQSSARLAEIHRDLGSVMDLSKAEDHVYFIETDERRRTYLVGKPIRVGGLLKSVLFDKTKTIVCTSATLCVGSSFSYMADEIGCNPHGSLVAESPFDWSSQAMFVTPGDMPEPNAMTFRDAVADKTLEVLLAARGRTLGLYTSRKTLDHVYQALVDKCPFHLLKQGEGPRVKLIEEFKSNVSSVLLGTESFWAGVDVPGEALSAVVIDRLPFPSPDDPIADAIAERDPKGWFKNYSVPRAVIQLKQGFGRLIRASTDVGVVVLLDRRIIDKGYGRIFFKSLPPGIALSRSIGDIRGFLERKDPDDMTPDELDEAFA